MAYIAPNSTLRLLHNVPLDPTYENTIYFASATAQASYFAGLAKYTLNQYTYLRKERVIRVGIVADNLYDVNYIMFQNTSFGSKWFYAFVTNIEYINNETAEISFVIDAMQTWLLDINLNPCFIERQHTVTDEIGDNLVPDNLETGDYVCRAFDGSRHNQTCVVVAATFRDDEDLTDSAGDSYSGIYSGLVYNVFQGSTMVEDVNDFLDRAVSANKESGIVSMFMMARDFVADDNGNAKSYTINKTKNLTDIDGYTPKNKKLFTHPYNFLYVTNLNGNACEFKYEYFSTENCVFTMAGDMSTTPTLIIAPNNYKGIPVNYNEKMTLSNYPQCAYNIDAFKAWLAQASTIVDLTWPIVEGAAGGFGQSMSGKHPAAMAGGSFSPAIAAGYMFTGAAGAIANSVAQIVDHATLPPQARGQSGNSAMLALGLKDFAFIPMTIRAEFARIIDDYWTKYGYPIHRIGTPNLIARPHWTYIKTIGSDLTGSIPATDMAIIKACFDNGITFWRNGSEVGNYNLDNSPAT